MEIGVRLPGKLNQWIVESEIGEGTYGKVFRVVDAQGDFCALKHIRIPETQKQFQKVEREMGKEASIRKFYEDLLQVLQTEIRVMEDLKGNANVVKIIDYLVVPRDGEIGWDIYILMELLTSFSQYREKKVFTEKDVIQLGIDICSALEICGKYQIIHRDIKPDNILVDGDGVFKLGDFGVAKHLENQFENHSLKGTFGFMAPEVFHGKNYGGTADVYSLALVMYQLLNNNREPFVKIEKQLIYYKDREKAMARRMSGELLPAPVEASKALAEILGRALEYEPESRFKNAREFRKMLQKLQRGKYQLGEAKYHGTNLFFKKLKSHRWAKMAGLVMALLLACGGSCYFVYQQMADDSIDLPGDSYSIEEYEQQLGEAGVVDEEEVSNYVLQKDELLWNDLKSRDSQRILGDFSELADDQLEEVYQYYEVDQIPSSGYTQKEKMDYQEKSESYCHLVIGGQDDYVYEVLRYYIYSENKEEDDDVCHGKMVRATMYYQVSNEDGNWNAKVLLPSSFLDEKAGYLGTMEWYLPEYETEQLAFHKADGVMDFTWLDRDFFFPNYFRLEPVAVYQSQEQLVLVLSAKNGRDETVTIQDISLQIKKYNRTFDCKEMDYSVQPKSGEVLVVRIDLDEELKETMRDEEWIFLYNDDSKAVIE